jgi:hypothetical protein
MAVDLGGRRTVRIRAPKELERIVSHGVKAGWFETRDGRSVALTDAGRLV